MGKTLFEKIWDSHVIQDFGDGRAAIHIDRHMLQEASCRVSFDTLRKLGIKVHDTALTWGVIDHAPSTEPGRTGATLPRQQLSIDAMRTNCAEFGVKLYDVTDPDQGIAHTIGPELGIVLPGCTYVCADSHTATCGGLGAWAWGVGTTQVTQMLATQMLIQKKPLTMRVNFAGRIGEGVFGKDLILHLIGRATSVGGAGYAVEYAGPAIREMGIEGRMTICNMSIEFGARTGFVAADDKTLEYLHGRRFAPAGKDWDEAVAFWRTQTSDADARFDTEIDIDCSKIVPQITWGTMPMDVTGIDGVVPEPSSFADKDRREAVEKAIDYIGLEPGQRMEGIPIDYAFIGTCTNARLSDLQEAAKIVRQGKVAEGVRALVVAGSTRVKTEAEALGLDKVFKDAGFEWRESGCSMCTGSNGDTVPAGLRSISTSNRNFEDRQGPKARTHLASPAMVAAAALTGKITDVRKFYR